MDQHGSCGQRGHGGVIGLRMYPDSEGSGGCRTSDTYQTSKDLLDPITQISPELRCGWFANILPSSGPPTDLTVRPRDPGVRFRESTSAGVCDVSAGMSCRQETPLYDLKKYNIEERSMHQWERGSVQLTNNSGDRGADRTVSMSGHGLMDQGHRAIIHNQLMASGLLMGPHRGSSTRPDTAALSPET